MDLRVSLVKGRLELKNPVLSAAGTFGSGLEYQDYGDLSTLGGIITNGLTLAPCSGLPMPRITEVPAGVLSAIGTQNDGVKQFVNEVLPRLPWNLVPVIPNLNASNVDAFSELSAILAEERGVAAMEVNLSCGNDHRGGYPFCQNPVTTARAISAVKRAAGDKPVIAKLSLRTMDIAEVAKAAEAAGADIISCIGMPEGMAVDVRTRRPLLGSVVGGISGPAIRPMALLSVWRVASVVQIPVIGVGGVCCAEDVLEFILAGAQAVCVGTASFADPSAIFRIVQNLPKVCEELEIQDLSAIRGSLELDFTR